MAHDGVFFRALGRTNARGAPRWRSVCRERSRSRLLTSTYRAMLFYVGFALTLNAAVAVAAAFVLRRREPAAERPYRMPLWPIPACCSWFCRRS